MCIVENNDKQFKQLIKDVSEIRDALLGNEYTKLGLVERVVEIENAMFDLKLLRSKIIGASIVVATGVSTIIPLLLKFAFNV